MTAEVHGTCRFFVQIIVNKKSSFYRVQPREVDPNVARGCWTLYKNGKKNSKRHDVTLTKAGSWCCTCEDFNYRQRFCKHVSAVRAVGLRETPSCKEEPDHE